MIYPQHCLETVLLKRTDNKKKLLRQIMSNNTSQDEKYEISN